MEGGKEGGQTDGQRLGKTTRWGGVRRRWRKMGRGFAQCAKIAGDIYPFLCPPTAPHLSTRRTGFRV